MPAVQSRARWAAAGAALFAGSATLLASPAPAHAATVFIEVNPSTIRAGFSVSLRASCGSTANPARATSDAFGSVTLTAKDQFLVGTATVPAGKPPHGYAVNLTCATGSKATTTLWVIGATDQPTMGPNTGGGYLADRGNGATMLIAGGLGAVGAGGVLALWAARRRRAGQ